MPNNIKKYYLCTSVCILNAIGYYEYPRTSRSQ